MRKSVDYERSRLLSLRFNQIPIGKWRYMIILALGLCMTVEGLDIVSMSIVLPHLKAVMHLAPHEVGILAAASTLGIAICAIPVGILADRFGRKTVLVWGFVICSLFTLMSGLAPTYQVLVLFRFLSGAGMSAIFIMPYTIVSELLPPEKRGSAIGMTDSLLGIGYLSAPLVGIILFRNFEPDFAWRLDLVLSGLPIVFIYFLIKYVPESPRWLISADKLDDAEKIIKHLEYRAGVVPGDATKGLEDEGFAVFTPIPAKRSLASVFKIIFSRPLIFQWLSLGCGAFGAFALFYVAIGYLPILFINRGLTFSNSLVYTLVATAFQIPGKLLGGFASNRIGRRLTFIYGVVLATLCLAMFIKFVDPVSTLVFATLFLFFIAGYVPPYKLWYAETFPTTVRTTGQTMVEGFFGRFLGGVVWISIFPMISNYFDQQNTLIFMMIMLAGTAIPAMLFVPETNVRKARDGAQAMRRSSKIEVP
ncbi:MFS transporter [Paraburkholderia aspalathi]|uniref:MFS transporter n=1 Tax=Paraburkholderia aspalathi TaxID=1324617 RepID=UPI001B13C56C|nr:MFS transporter [Paraburkholderia aspalathi]CAE6840904.1 Putative niacin/nicotinamide transporter NaiP [Paraburkholderia aspalathi]